MNLKKWQNDFAVQVAETNPQGALSVYRNNTRNTLTLALKDAYPAVHALVGEDCFHSIATNYVHAHPSQSTRLLVYGEQMPAFLGTLPLRYQLPYLKDVARLEWAIHRLRYLRKYLSRSSLESSFAVGTIHRMALGIETARPIDWQRAERIEFRRYNGDVYYRIVASDAVTSHA